MTSPFAETLTKADADSALAPGGACGRDSSVRAKARSALSAAETGAGVSTITAAHEMAFSWLRHDTDTPFGLVSCFVNGKPSALVVAARPHHDQRQVEIMPLFVALTDGMVITAPDGELIFGQGGVQ